MVWTATNPVTVGAPTKKSHYDALWDNVMMNKDASTGNYIIPNNAGVPSGPNSEGEILWDSVNDELYVGLGGSNYKKIGSSLFTGFKAYLSANQTIAHATWTKVQFDFETYDVGGYYDNATNYRWTPPAGKITLSCYIQWNIGGGSSAPSTIYLSIYKNGIQWDNGALISNYDLDNGVIGFVNVTDDNANGTDYYEVYVYHGSGVDQTLAGNNTRFMGRVIS